MKSEYRCRWWLGVTLILGGLFATTAQAADNESNLSGSAAVVSNYLFRGLSQTNQQPALQAGIEYAGSQGLYAGAWGSNVSWLSDASSDSAPISNSLEFDGYVGWRTTFAGDFSFDVGLYGYAYPGSYPSGFTSPNTVEAYVGIGYGDFSLKYSHALTNLFGFDQSRNSHYLDLSWSHAIAPAWALSAHVGHQVVEHATNADYSDWNVAVSHDFSSGYSVALGYYGTNAARAVYTNAYNHYLGRSTAVLSLSKGF